MKTITFAILSFYFSTFAKTIEKDNGNEDFKMQHTRDRIRNIARFKMS